jgi:hypothetical protein
MSLAKERRITKAHYIYTFLVAIAIILFCCAYIWRTFSGYYFYDDYEYAKAAFQLTKGSFSVIYDTFTHRLVFIALVACSFSLFGINDFSTVLLPATAFLGTLTILFLYLRKQTALCLYSVAITGLNSYFLFFIDKLIPDTLVTFFCLLAGIIAQQYRQLYPIKAGVGIAALLFAAFLTKETSLYCWPFFWLLLIQEGLKRSRVAKQFTYSTVLLGLILFFAYFLIYYLYTGDAFYRFNSIMDNHYTHAESYFDKPFSYLLARLTYAPWQMFTESGLLVAIFPGLVMALASIRNEKLSLQTMENFWSWFAVLFLVCFYFGTTSLRYYNPLNLLPRMYFPLLPPFAILAGIFWVKAENSSKIRIWLFILFATTAGYCFWVQSKYTLIYTAYAFVAFLPAIIRFKHSLQMMHILFIFIGLSIPLYRMIRPQQWGYQAEKKLFHTYLSHTNGTHLVITDQRLALTHSWFYQFQPPANYTFTDLTKADVFPDKAYTNIFVLYNPHTFRETFGSFMEWNQWEQKNKQQLEKLAELDSVILYRIRETREAKK